SALQLAPAVHAKSAPPFSSRLQLGLTFIPRIILADEERGTASGFTIFQYLGLFGPLGRAHDENVQRGGTRGAGNPARHQWAVRVGLRTAMSLPRMGGCWPKHEEPRSPRAARFVRRGSPPPVG